MFIIRYYYHSLYVDGLEMNKISYTFNLRHVTYVAGDFQEKNKILIYFQSNTQTRKMGNYKKEGCRGVSKTLFPKTSMMEQLTIFTKTLHHCRAWWQSQNGFLQVLPQSHEMALHLSSIIIYTSIIIYLYITLHLSFICRRHYRTRPVFVRSLATEVLFVRF